MRRGVLRGWRRAELDAAPGAILGRAYDAAMQLMMDAADVDVVLEGSTVMSVSIDGQRVGSVDGRGLASGPAPGRLVRRRARRPRHLLLIRVSGSRHAHLDELFGPTAVEMVERALTAAAGNRSSQGERVLVWTAEGARLDLYFPDGRRHTSRPILDQRWTRADAEKLAAEAGWRFDAGPAGD